MESVQPVVRSRRFVRHRHRKSVFVMQPRDHRIVKLVAQHRVIASDDIQLLIPGSDQSILRRLQLLFHHGYLDRPRSQRQFGNTSMVYALGNRGAALVAQQSSEGDDWTEKNRQLGPLFLEHALMVSRFQARLEHACRTTGFAVIDRWLGDGAVRESVDVDGANGPFRVPVAPDAYFILQALMDDTGRIHCFLEADRGTMTVSRFLTKLRGYFAFWRSGRAEKRFGMRNFLVLTLARTPERTTNLLAASRQVSSRGLRMFLFGAESAYQSTDGSCALDAIWQTPGDTGRHSLLE